MSLNDSERGNEEMETVYTCGMCETICKADEIESHSCLASFTQYYMDKQHYFYPQCEDGNILRRSLVDGTEQNVMEIPQSTEENIQKECSQEDPDEDDFDVSNLPENEYLRRTFIEERLIEAIRRRPPLWNFKLPIAERGVRSKEKLWMDMVAVMRGVITLSDAKKKWKSLSDTFRRHRKAAELPSGSAAQKMSKWVHFDRMSFLRDVNLPNDTTSNIPVAHDDTSVDADYDSVDDSTTSNASRTPCIDRSRRRRNTDDNFMDEMRQLMQEPINVDVQQNVARPSPSAGFCNTIAYKLDALSEDARDRAMMRILEILREERHRDQA